MSVDAFIDAVIHRHVDELMAKPNVVAVGRGAKDGQSVIEVCVRQKVPAVCLAPIDLIPAQVEGVKTNVVEIGDVSAEASDPATSQP